MVFIWIMDDNLVKSTTNQNGLISLNLPPALNALVGTFRPPSILYSIFYRDISNTKETLEIDLTYESLH